MPLPDARIARATLACFFVAFAAHAHEPSPAGDGEIRVEAEIQPFVSVEARPLVRRADASQILSVTLPAPAAVNKAMAAPRAGVPLQVGFGREVAALADGHANAARMQWKTLESGAQVGAFSVSSPGALALRVGLRVKAIPAETRVRFYAPSGPVYEASAGEIQERVGRNLKAGELSADALLFWSPPVEGDTLVVEVELPAGQGPGQLDLAAPTISHLVGSPANHFAEAVAKSSATCELDVMCYPAWANESNSEARILFQDGGSGYLCSGTLIADTDTSTSIPFFLTASHCINNQSAASSMVSYWFWRSTACDSGVRGATQALPGGATLVYNTTSTDASLLRLANAPPGGAVYAGWSVGATPMGAGVAGIHHPGGDLQKISFGTLSGYLRCSSSGSESFSCNAASSSTGTFVESTWSSGLTEPGSSGSGLFTQTGHYLIGQLYGGSSSTCGVGDPDVYGRFDTAYHAGLGAILSGASTGGTSGGSTPPPPITPAADYSAMWWNPSESGWGLDITQHGSSFFAAWYAYNSAGNSSWLVMPGGTWTSPTSITGNLYRTSGPSSSGPFNTSQVTPVMVGKATLSFQAADRAVLSFTVDGISGTKAIQREDFGVPDPTPVTSYADLWWNASESGWGLTVNQQYRTVFALLYSYGQYGQPVWYAMPGGTWSSANTYTGTLYRTTATAGGVLYGAAFDPASVQATPVGTMTMQFGSASAATLTYSIDGQVTTKAITREPF